MTTIDVVDTAATVRFEECPVDTAVAVIAGKWKLLVLRPLYLHGPMRYNDLQRAIGGIAAKELSRNLRELEYAGLVRVSPAPGDGARYELTDLGIGLGETFRTLGEFGTEYLRLRHAGARRASMSETVLAR